MISVGTPLLWGLFAAFVLAALLVDFLALSRQGAHRVSMLEAGIWSLVWVAVSGVFVGWLWWYLGGADGNPVANAKALEFVTGYLVEKALAVDNIFVFLMVFTYFAITTDPFIVLTSNVFAILGLRALYFLLAGVHERFHLLSYGLAIVLVFIGCKMLLVDIYKIPVSWSLGFTVAVLAVTMLLSLRIPPPARAGTAYPFKARREPPDDDR